MVATRTIYNNHKVKLNYYQILGVLQTASRDKIIKVYLKSIKRTSMDNKGQDPQLINLKIVQYRTAYNVLSNDSTRKAYDQQLVRSTRTRFFIM